MPPDPHRTPNLSARTAALVRQMDWFRGLRAAVALCAPLVLGDLAGIAHLGWAALGGFEAILADTGGPYRTRMASLTTLSLGGAAGLFLGSLAGGHIAWALPVTLAFCFFWSYLAVLGQPFTQAGLLVQVIYICGIGAPTPDWHEALSRGLLLLAGGAWAALLSLFLWPLDAYRPARSAVAACYTELASFLKSIVELSARNTQRAALWHRLAKHHQYRLRRAIELGWQAVAAIRAEHQVETAQGHQLVVLLEHADLLLARSVALAEHFELEAGNTGSPCAQYGLAGLEELQSTEQWIAALLTRRRGQTALEAGQRRIAMQALPASLAGCVAESDSTTRFLLAQVTEAASLLDTAVESAALLRLGALPALADPGKDASSGHFGYVHARLAELRPTWNFARVADQLAANFHRGSLLLRHAARVALVCGFDVVLISIRHIDHGYWLLMTSLIVLQPHVSGTMRRGLERIGGTVGGGILAAFLAIALHSQLATAAVLFPLALLSIAMLPVSYTAYAFFLTPAFVLAWLPFSGDWQLALIRTVNTIVGALVSLLAMALLFPAWERERSPQFLRASIAADRVYLQQLQQSWKTRSPSTRLIANARRATGLAHNDTEESLERLLAETWPRRRPFAQFVAAFVTYLRRFAQSVTALTALEGDWTWKQSSGVQSRLDLLQRRLQWLEDQTGSGQALSTWPQIENGAPLAALLPQVSARSDRDPRPDPQPDHPGERQLERLERQVEVLRRQILALREHGWIPTLTKS
jgi:uncharacterized membrane protein YccC